MEDNNSEGMEIPESVAKIAAEIKKEFLFPDGELMRQLGVWLTCILLKNHRADIRVEDNGYDFSSFGVPTHDPFDLSDYETVGEFLAGEATGGTIATHVSGSGFAAETYDDQAFEIAIVFHSGFLEKKIPEAFGGEELYDDDYFDQLRLAGCDSMDLLEAFKAVPLVECYTRYLPDAVRLRHEKRVAAQERAEAEARYRQLLIDLAGELPSVLQAAVGNTRYEKRNCGELLAILDAFAAEHGKQKVGAALKQCRLDLSNSMSQELAFRYPTPPGP